MTTVGERSSTSADVGGPAVEAPAHLRRDWTLAVALGELVGFVPPAVTGATLAALGAPDIALVVGLTVAGAVEGLSVGVAQATVLRRTLPEVDRRRWVRATALGAAFAWFVGMGGGALMGSSVAPPLLLLVVMVPAWTAALLAMGFLQWRVLRETVPHSGRWVPVNAGAWLLGVMIVVVALSAAPNSWPGAVHAVIGVVAAVAMGLTVGALTARTLTRLLAVPPRSVNSGGSDGRPGGNTCHP